MNLATILEEANIASSINDSAIEHETTMLWSEIADVDYIADISDWFVPFGDTTEVTAQFTLIASFDSGIYEASKSLTDACVNIEIADLQATIDGLEIDEYELQKVYDYLMDDWSQQIQFFIVGI